MVDETQSEQPTGQRPRTLWGLLDRIADFEKAIEPLSDRVDAAIQRLTEKIGKLREKAQEAHSLLDDLEKTQL